MNHECEVLGYYYGMLNLTVIVLVTIAFRAATIREVETLQARARQVLMGSLSSYRRLAHIYNEPRCED